MEGKRESLDIKVEWGVGSHERRVWKAKKGNITAETSVSIYRKVPKVMRLVTLEFSSLLYRYFQGAIALKGSLLSDGKNMYLK